MGRMGKHEAKERGRQYIRSILTLTVIFNSAPRFAKWAEFLCSPRTYSFQIGYVYFPLGFQFFICSCPVTAASNLRGRIMMHTAVKTLIYNTDFPVIFASRCWTASQPLHPMAKKPCLKFCTSKSENIKSHIWNSFQNFTSAPDHLMMKAPCDP